MTTTVYKWREAVMGNKLCILADITTSTSSDTFATGLKVIESYTCDPGSAAVTSSSKSGGTITVGSSAGANNVQICAWGY